jgi:hypothetical protein
MNSLTIKALQICRAPKCNKNTQLINAEKILKKYNVLQYVTGYHQK